MKKIQKLSLLSALLLLGACTATGSSSNLQYTVNENTRAIRQLQAQIANVQPAQADSWSQLQALRQEVAALKGSLDNLQNSTAHLGGTQELGNIIARHDRALRLIETQLAMDLQLNDPASPMQTPNTVPTENTNTAMITTPTPNGQNQSAVQNAVQPNTQNPAAQTVQPAQTSDTAQALYDSGINSFNSRDYQKGLNAFKDFTTVYPDHKLVSNAWFWQGECQYQLKNYAGAALAYEKVISQFPNSNKAPACYLKQAMSFIELNKKDAAKQRLNELVSIYPKAAEAKRAQTILQTL